MLLWVTILLFFLESTSGQQKSPCPDVFQYDGQDLEEDRWYGHLTLTTPNLLTGIWLQINLDQPAELLRHTALYRYRSKGSILQYICGGSLISPSHILTAAHCVTKPKTGGPVSPDLFTVYLGKYNLYKVGPSVQDRTVKKITTHPEFNATYFHNDLAVLHLDGAIQISDFVRTVCLWDEDVSLNSVTEKVGTVVGWGFDQHGNVTENLMKAKMPIVSTETCILSNRDFSRFTSSKTYCAGFSNGTSVCTGDSGSGMVLPKSNTQGQNSVWQLRGVISLSAKLQNEGVACNTSNYIVFTDVAKHIDWIRNVIKT